MLNQNLIITLGVTSLASIAIWFYFKDRLGKVEKKFDLMFNIFQEQQKTTQVLNNNLNSLADDIYQNKVVLDTSDNEGETEDVNKNFLIKVSDTEANDDEESYYSTDSEVVSDNEENDNPIKINPNEETVNTNLNLESMPFSINGADLNINPSMLETMFGGIGTPLEQVSIGNNLDITIEDDNVNLEDNNEQDLDEQDLDEQDLDEQDLDEDDTQEAIANQVIVNQAIANQAIANQSNVDKEENLDNGENDDEEVDLEETESVASENSFNFDNIDIHDPKTTVKILKSLAQKKGLRSRGLKKEKLVELLENNP
jgi:hypothetical protein